MAKRLIDADALMELYELGEELEEQAERLNVPIPVIRQNIKDAPTVDAVEVVRCKECVNYCGFEHCKNGICDVDVVSKRAVNHDDFCSYGERKKMENNDLISRKALIEAYDKAHKGSPGGARKLMEEAPGVDAVEVVRCRDCKHGENLCDKQGLCTYCQISIHSYPVRNQQDDFCSYGERRTDGEL